MPPPAKRLEQTMSFTSASPRRPRSRPSLRRSRRNPRSCWSLTRKARGLHFMTTRSGRLSGPVKLPCTRRSLGSSTPCSTMPARPEGRRGVPECAACAFANPGLACNGVSTSFKWSRSRTAAIHFGGRDGTRRRNRQAQYAEGNLWVATVRDPAGNVIGLWQDSAR